MEYWSLTLRFAAIVERSQRATRRRRGDRRVVEAINRRLVRLADQFITGVPATGLPTRPELGLLAGRGARFGNVAVVDVSYLGAACAGMIGADGEIPPGSVLEWREWWLSVVEWLTDRPRELSRRQRSNADGSTADRIEVYGEDDKLIRSVARVAASVSDDDYARQLWKPLFGFGEEWAARFVDHWLGVPAGDVDPHRYLRRWREVIQEAGSLDRPGSALHAASVGMSGGGPQHWGPHGPALMAGVRDLVAGWMAHASYSSDLASAARTLRLAACEPIRVAFVPEILNAVRRTASQGRFRPEDGEAIGRYAKDVWDGGKLGVASVADLNRLVDHLAVMHVPTAIDLQRAMARSVGSSIDSSAQS